MFKQILILSVLSLTGTLAFTGAALGNPAFTNESQLGSAIVSGNSNSQTLNAQQSNSYSWDRNVAKITGRYLNANANGVESARNWDGSLRYERVLAENFSAFASHTVESDIYSGYVQRDSYDLGGKYFFTQSEDTKWSAEAGYRYFYTHFVSPTPDSVDNAVRVYSEFMQTLSKTSSFKVTIEYVQSFTNAQSYLLNSETSLSVVLSSIFSLKTAYLTKYTNAVYFNNGPKNLTTGMDTVFTTSIVAKF